METVLSSMISNLALPPPTSAELPAHQLESAGSPTPPNSSTSTSTSLAVRTPSATSPATNSSTPGTIVHPLLAPSQMVSPPGGSHQQNGQQGQQQQRTSRTFFRPPGLGPDGADMGGEQFPTNVMVCPQCGFSCSSKFHYNSHMNTHSTHQCSMCNYQSRTEGRLKKHMQQSHTHEQRVAAGICISPPPPPQPCASTPGQNSPKSGEPCMARGDSGNVCGGGIPTSIAPLLNSMLSDNLPNGSHHGLESFQSLLNNANNNPLAQQFSNSTDALLKICTDAISNSGPNEKTYSSPQMGDLGPTALDQLRALAERQAVNLLATSTANALGFVGGELQIGQDGMIIGGQENGGEAGKKQQQEAATPRRSGKPKQYKCKQCQQISRSKKEQWAHAKLHIPKQKQLTCELCDFVTEYKHHLEYHYRNHNGQKPFKCNTCAYTCVNKSMLNSHMKSHTPVYQFRCQDCTYQTKYCHSLKMHLKKYGHKRAPGIGGSDSSGEERPENASSSSVGKDESFENVTSAGQSGHSGGEIGAEGMAELAAGMGRQSASGHHHPLLAMAHHHHHQPMVDPEMEMASQRFMLQQQLEQMNELIRNAVVNCPHCNFSTGNIDDMNRHLLFHLIATQQQLPPLSNEQQALASIYQRVAAQLQQELAPDGVHPPPQHAPMLHGSGHQDPSILLGHALAAANSVQQNGGGEMPMELEKAARQMEREAAESIRQQQARGGRGGHSVSAAGNFAPPTTIAALLEMGTRGNGGGGAAECSGSGGTPTNATEPAGGPSSGMKKEFNGHHHHHFGMSGGEATSNGNGGGRNGECQQMESEPSPVQRSPTASGTCLIKNVMPHHHLLSGLPSNAANNFEQQPNNGGNNGGFGGSTTNLLNNYSSNQVRKGGITHHHSPLIRTTIIPAPATCHFIASNARLPSRMRQYIHLPTHHHHSIPPPFRVLYQLHCGYHSIESPFKCNRCGHHSGSALEFNLHLYQANHE